MPRRNCQMRGSANRPPQFSSNIRVRHTFRFTGSMAGVALTGANLLLACGVVAGVANGTAWAIFHSLRIRRLKIWSPPASQGTVNTCSIEWLGTQQSPSIEFSDTTNSVSTPACVQSSPPLSSNAAFWQTPTLGSTTLAVLTAPAGSVVDVEVDLILADEAAASFNTNLTASTAGELYYLALDGRASNLMVPVSLNTTA